VSAGTLRRRKEPVHSTFIVACRATWDAAPVVVAISLVWGLTALPLIAGVVGAIPVPLILLTLPPLVVTTCAFQVWAAVANGGPIGRRQLTRLDPGLALIAWGIALTIEILLTSGDVGVVLACVVGALSALIMPLAFAYGAVRDRQGLAALRGGLVLAVIHPDLALTLAAMAVLVGFAIVISAGALVLCLPALVGVFACGAVAADLHRLGVMAP
jgi:hypothetical protein